MPAYAIDLRGYAMETKKKLLAGGLCLLLCAVVYARLSSVRTDLRQAEFDFLARLYVSAAPYALITPVKLHVRTAAVTFPDSDGEPALKSAPVAATNSGSP